MSKKIAEWSFRKAARIYGATLRGDLGGFDIERKKLLQSSDVKQGHVGTISFLEGGNTKNGKPVLFFHGSPGSALDWRLFLKEKQNRYHIIAFDRPGFGADAKKTPELERDFLLLGEVAKKICGDKKCILVGHSLGGGVAAHLAARYPELVEGIVFVGASLDPALEKIFWIQNLFTFPPFSWALSRSIRHSNVELLQYAGSFLKRLEPGRVTCPVTVVHSYDDPLVSYKNTAFIRENFINAASLNIISLDSGGHFLNETRPQDIRKAIEALES